MIKSIRINFESPALLAALVGARMGERRAGTIAVITSVAGDRGRQSNYTYGAAKGGLQRFLEGLRHRLQCVSVHVLDIRPGLILTPMTRTSIGAGRSGLDQKQLPGTSFPPLIADAR